MIDLEPIAKVLIDPSSASTRVIVKMLKFLVEESIALPLMYLPALAPYAGSPHSDQKQSENSHIEVSSFNEFSSTNVLSNIWLLSVTGTFKRMCAFGYSLLSADDKIIILHKEILLSLQPLRTIA